MRRRDLAWLASLALVTAACGPSRARMAGAQATADVRPAQWNDAFARYTRSEKTYDHLETRLIVSATWRCGAFADAYANEYARRYVLSDSQRESFRKREESDAQSYQVFFLAAYTPESRWNDFSKRDSMWKIRLYDDKGNAVEPLVVTKVKDDDPTLHEFFPYFTLWTKGYVVKFAKDSLDPESKSYKLQITSSVGAAELAFDRAGADRPPMERASAHAAP